MLRTFRQLSPPIHLARNYFCFAACTTVPLVSKFPQTVHRTFLGAAARRGNHKNQNFFSTDPNAHSKAKTASQVGSDAQTECAQTESQVQNEQPAQTDILGKDAAQISKQFADTPFPEQVFATLGLNSFTEQELHEAFERFDLNHDKFIDKGELRTLVRQIHGGSVCEADYKKFIDELWNYEVEGKDDPRGITEEQFKIRTRALAQTLDSRVWPLTGMFLTSGVAIGIMVPCLPLIVQVLLFGVLRLYSARVQ